MNLKLKALLLTGGFFVVCIGFAMVIEWFLTSLTAAQIAFAFQCLVVFLLGYAVYGIILAKLEMEKSLDELNKL